MAVGAGIDLWRRAAGLIPGGVNSPVRAMRSVGLEEPVFMARGEGAFVEVHPEDAEKHGLSDGGRATVRTDAGEAELAVRVTEHIAQGAVFVPFNQPGLAANRLLAGSFTASATVEAASAPPDAEGAVAVAASGGAA